jgi:hypothetical protein
VNDAEIISLVYSEVLKVVGGAAVVVLGLSAFLGKVWADRIARREAQVRDEKIAELKANFERQNADFKARLDVASQRQVLVDRVQFEHEYEIYKQAWVALVKLRRVTLQMRPTLDHIDLNESKEDRMKRRIGDFIAPFNAYSEIVETNKPFYPEKVYVALADVRDRCHEELIDYEFTERPGKDYWSEARVKHKEIVESIDRACESIRTRISEVRVQ